MKKFIIGTVSVCALFFLGGCVESSQKYKDLQGRLDSLSVAYNNQNAEMEGLFADLNDISAGMQSIREAEKLLTLEAEENAGASKSKKQIALLKADIKAITEAIAGYKDQINKLDGRNKRQSAEFKKLIASLNEELEVRTQKIAEITAQLAERDKQLLAKTQEVEGLNKDVADLNQQSAAQKMTITEQDQAIHTAHYLVGSRKELKEANVITRQGIFCPPIVSSQVQKASFKDVDIREAKSIALNGKKAKVLSVHPEDSYSLEAGEDGMLNLVVKDENAFWGQTKYLVVMVN